ncbi:hypothetical protein [Paenibacillus alginolyticus]|uniref:Uncharacterized protein n=1 Tax=Paenibacillus alginolyticus TaxID=59839 RepID=A0ABT4GJW5_9BACL|nr:hypothetical protein [Paenibacillus alginolyticus]MCY9696475.1 hypothetical protein [Paenibacillus alginolyticus]MEC0144739.1 hypothetical protein [Paenibacillus alginolyticus]
MDWYSHIPIGTITLFSMLVLGLTLFRISVKTKWPLVLLASFVISCLFRLFLSQPWAQSLEPMLIIVTEAVFIHYIFRVRKLHALMVAFLGSLGYTIYLAIVLFIMPLITHISIAAYFEGLDSSYRALKIVAALLTYLTALVLVKKRLGFTVRIELSSKSAWLPQKNVLLHVFLLAFVLFSLAYYGVALKITSIFYFAAGLCLLLGWIIYLLYRKEMEEM